MIRYFIIYPEIKYPQGFITFPVCLEMIYTFHITLLTFGIIKCSAINWISYFPKDHIIYLKQWIEYLLGVFHLETNIVSYKYYYYRRRLGKKSYIAYHNLFVLTWALLYHKYVFIDLLPQNNLRGDKD